MRQKEPACRLMSVLDDCGLMSNARGRQSRAALVLRRRDAKLVCGMDGMNMNNGVKCNSSSATSGSTFDISMRIAWRVVLSCLTEQRRRRMSFLQD